MKNSQALFKAILVLNLLVLLFFAYLTNLEHSLNRLVYVLSHAWIWLLVIGAVMAGLLALLQFRSSIGQMGLGWKILAILPILNAIIGIFVIL